MKTVSFIIVNMNGKRLLDDLLDSLGKLDYPPDKLEIIIVDNGSKDGSVKYVEKRHPEVSLIKNERNMGFAYPCNQGAKIAGGEYLAFVNNDMVLDRSWLNEMLRYIDRGDNAICVGSKILNADGTKIDFVEGVVNYVGLAYQKHFGKDAALFDDKTAKDILFACGGAMLVDRAVFLDTGGFDEDYFAFFEDVDFGWRLWVMGYKVVFAPTAVAYHRHHQTAKRIPRQIMTTLYERNSLYTIYKNYSEENLKKVFPAAFIMSAMRLLDFSGVDVSKYVIAGPNNAVESYYKKKNNPVQAAYRRIMGNILEIFSSVLLDFRFNTRMCLRDRSRHKRTVREAPNCFSPAVAVTQFGFNLEHLKKKRAAIQEGRKRSDTEIIERFKDCFGLESSIARYNRLGQILKDLWN